MCNRDYRVLSDPIILSTYLSVKCLSVWHHFKNLFRNRPSWPPYISPLTCQSDQIIPSTGAWDTSLDSKKHGCISKREMVVWQLTGARNAIISSDRQATTISFSVLKFPKMNTNCLPVMCCRPGFCLPRIPWKKNILLTDAMHPLSIFSVLIPVS